MAQKATTLSASDVSKFVKEEQGTVIVLALEKDHMSRADDVAFESPVGVRVGAYVADKEKAIAFRDGELVFFMSFDGLFFIVRLFLRHVLLIPTFSQKFSIRELATFEQDMWQGETLLAFSRWRAQISIPLFFEMDDSVFEVAVRERMRGAVFLFVHSDAGSDKALIDLMASLAKKEKRNIVLVSSLIFLNY